MSIPYFSFINLVLNDKLVIWNTIKTMESSSDIVNLIVALATAIPALIAGIVGIVKANHAKEMITVLQQTNTQAVNVNQQITPDTQQRRKEES